MTAKPFDQPRLALEPLARPALRAERTEAARNAANTVVVGWLLVGHLVDVDRQAALAAHARTAEALSETFGAHRWCFPLVEQPELPTSPREEPARLLEHAANERDARSWDVAVVITASDLVAYFRSRSWATPSRSLGIAVISTARIDPGATRGEAAEDGREARLSQRIFALALHTLGHLAGAHHRADPTAAMHPPAEVADLDAVVGYRADSIREMRTQLRRAAELRLEDVPRRGTTVTFYAAAIARNWRTVLSGIRLARPWSLPFRLSRLTLAALAAIVLLPTTAEIWELADAHRLDVLSTVAAVSLVFTSVFIIKRQRLFLGRTDRVTEQTVITHAVVTGIVSLGMLSTLLLLLVVSLGLSVLFFPAEVVVGWMNRGASDGAVLVTYARVAAMLGAIGLALGAVGASFEDQQYLRHVAYVDEEV